jgi:hypothetical protein
MDLKRLRELEQIVFDLDFRGDDATRVVPPKPMTATKMLKFAATSWEVTQAKDRSQSFLAHVLAGRFEIESEERYEQFVSERPRSVVENAVAELIESGNAVRVVHAIISHLCDIIRVSRFYRAPKTGPALQSMAEGLFARHLDVLLWEMSSLSQRFRLPLKRAKLRDVCLNFFANPGSKAAQAKMRFVTEKILSWRRRMVERSRDVKANTVASPRRTVKRSRKREVKANALASPRRAARQDKKAAAKTSGLSTLYYERNGRDSKLHDGKGYALTLSPVYIDNLLTFVDHMSGEPQGFLQAGTICAAWNRPFRQRGKRGEKLKGDGETAATVVKRILSKIKIRLSEQMPSTQRRISPVFRDLLAGELTDHGEDCCHKLRFNLRPFTTSPLGGTPVPPKPAQRT